MSFNEANVRQASKNFRNAYNGLLPSGQVSEFLKKERQEEHFLHHSRAVLVFRAKQFTCFEPRAMYGYSFPDPTSSLEFLQPEADDETLGKALYDAFKQCRLVEPKTDPDIFDETQVEQRYHEKIDRLLSACEAGDRSAALGGIRHCRAWWNDGAIELIPLRQAHPGKWVRLDDVSDIVVSELATNARLGEALNLAFNCCR